MKKNLLLTFLILLLNGCGCREYSSDYSCSYIKNKATYEVYYWNDISLRDGEKIGTVIGLSSCRELARRISLERNQQFHSRKYLCFLMENGVKMERHRPLD